MRAGAAVPRQGAVFARLLAVVRRIPRGRVATYGQVAALAGLKRYARHVGYALHGLAPGSPLPWHRVLNARGRISLPPGSEAQETQRLRLEREGVRFGAHGAVALDRYQWRLARPPARVAPGPQRSTVPSGSGSMRDPCSKPTRSRSLSTPSRRTSAPATSRR